ncbi:1-phosphofructokinase [Nocardiopsis sp. NRRL B-16309]|uniref:1-phosphofructokinase n=1 Tax=Nocardiopsis sp. NRRL B-16309 TaxID=1519494 RepID=UPI0006AF2738|nr:1-phosphofructokinase [Nocardiopsis sp. NRRL B-16309]KOX17007.1 6-phosphofructokinase [Nocardiopsis sp. NRRL B-16309]
MILTLTPNPSVDHTLEVDGLVRGEVLRVRATRAHPGGKGVNVARALSGADVPTRAVLPVGGGGGAELSALLGDLPRATVPIEGETRANITVAEPDGTTTKLNAPGPVLSPAEIRALLDVVEDELTRGPDWIVACGSLPGGATADFYVRVAELAARYGVPLALDSSGEPLAEAARAGSVALLKPNHEELEELTGRDLPTVGAVVSAAREVLSWGNEQALVTLGGHGAILVDDTCSWWARGPLVRARSTVGAGDCSLAGFLSQDGPPDKGLARAVSWGAAAVSLPGTTVPTPEDVAAHETTVVAEPEPHQRIDRL